VANSCTSFRSNLALQTPVYDTLFLKEYKPMDSPLIGRHQTGAWEDGTGDTHYFDRITVGQPDLSKEWGRIDAAECGTNSCNPPRSFVAFGTDRDSYFKEQIVLQSQLFCLTQLRHQTRPGEQITEIYRSLKQIPEMFTTEFIRNRAFRYAPTVQIAGDDFATFTPAASTVVPSLTTINLTASGLPTSQLTWPYLNYLTTALQLEGYEQESGLPMGLYNLITDPRAWFLLTNGSADIKEMMALSTSEQASPLYRVAVDGGIQKPFGNIAPTLDKFAPRFQVLSGSILNRVYPYYNATTGDTGTKRVVNPAYLRARYQLSFLWHPMAIKIWTKAFKKLSEKVPSVNSSLYGEWQFVNNQGVMSFTQPDGTVCTLNNDLQNYFYWLVAMEMGFQYKYPELIVPILHLVDGSGYSSTVDSPVCGSAPQYVAQSYTDYPVEC